MGTFNEEGVYFSDEGCIECDWGELPCHCGEADFEREQRLPSPPNTKPEPQVKASEQGRGT